jgi:hypothetical protein
MLIAQSGPISISFVALSAHAAASFAILTTLINQLPQVSKFFLVRRPKTRASEDFLKSQDLKKMKQFEGFSKNYQTR